ncbi:IclR family transcriptional regulator [Lacisediminimonas profundi]|uniref:IclR family transcriptional regulator n=1 Tax=Lacisediminimonas profundi TaxID=2603856 RepID=UPI00124B7872|nr:IclR family transcriptional regulator [Lacisediminimonas profundi]
MPSTPPKKLPPPASATKDLSLSVLKASQLLTLVGDSENGTTLKDLAKATGFGTTVCHRMLATLEIERLIDRDPSSGRYKLGLGMLAFAHKVQSRHPLTLQAADLVAETVRHTDDIALLMVRDGDEAVCIDRKEGRYPLRSSGTQVGTRLPLHCGGGPQAILSFSPDSYIDHYLSTSPLEKRTAKTLTDPKLIRAQIAKTRARGYAVGNQDLFEYVVAIGVPIFAADGALLGSISIGGLVQRYDNKRIKEVGEWLAASAQKISASRK